MVASARTTEVLSAHMVSWARILLSAPRMDTATTPAQMFTHRYHIFLAHERVLAWLSTNLGLKRLWVMRTACSIHLGGCRSVLLIAVCARIAFALPTPPRSHRAARSARSIQDTVRNYLNDS